MNKLFKKIGAVLVGTAMMVGAGAAVGASLKAPDEIKAAYDTGTSVTYSYSTSGAHSNGVNTWTASHLTITQAVGTGQTDPNSSYLSNPRWYSGNIVTITPKSGYLINGLQITATSTNYASTLSNSTWGNASASANDTTVTVTAADPSAAITVSLSGQSRLGTSLTYWYSEAAAFGTLESIEVLTLPTKLTYDLGDTFSSSGLTLTATDTESHTRTVDSGFSTNYDSHTFVEADAGTKTVTVTYNDKETTFDILVLNAPLKNTTFNACDRNGLGGAIKTNYEITEASTYKWVLSSTEYYSSNIVLGDYSSTNGLWDSFKANDCFAGLAASMESLSINGAKAFAAYTKNFGVVNPTKVSFSIAGGSDHNKTLYILGTDNGGVSWKKCASSSVSGTASGSVEWIVGDVSFAADTPVMFAIVFTAGNVSNPQIKGISYKLYGSSLSTDVSWKAIRVEASAPVDSIPLGETLQLSSTLYPSFAVDTVSWSSSSEEIATVSDSGLVSAVAEGNVVITAATSQGKTDTVELSITGARVYVTGVSISEGASASVAVNRTLQLHAVVTPDNATTNTVTWTSSDEDVATVSGTGLVTPITQGTVTITVTCDGETSGGENPSASCVVTVGPSEYSNVASSVLVSGKKYKIVAPVKSGNTVTNYYLKSNGSASQPSGVTNSWEATIFTFNLVDNNTWTVTSGNNYLKFTSGNNSNCRVASGSDNWIVAAAANTNLAGEWSMKSVNGGNRFLCLYNQDKFQGYQSESTNRDANISFVPFDAEEFASDIVNATGTVCDGTYAHSSANFTSAAAGKTPIWDYLSTNYALLSNEEKALLVGATYTRNEATVTATGGTSQAVAEGVARHDYLVDKYGLTNILAGRSIPSSSNNQLATPFMTSANDFSVILVVTILVVSTFSIAAMVIVSRRRKEN